MPRQVRQRTILDVTTNTYGGSYYLGRKQTQHLFTVNISGVATVSVQGRQKGEPWVELGTTAVTDEVNLDTYGWYEVRAVSSGMGAGATAKVVWSWE